MTDTQWQNVFDQIAHAFARYLATLTFFILYPKQWLDRARISQRLQIMKTVLVLALALFSLPAFSQTQTAGIAPTRIQFLGNVEFDAYNNLGYRPPTLFGGVGLEYPIGQHFELQFGVSGGWTRKYITNNGVSLTSKAQLLYWLNKRVGVTGGFGSSDLWTSQFNKVLLYPTAGMVLRDTFSGAAGRLYIGYKFPTGCQWATANNPCAIQSSRLQGVEVYQEFTMTKYIRVGGSFAVYHGLEQSNQNEPSIPRTAFWVPTAGITVRFQFPGRDWDEPY
jgi:hypothetical protein